MVQVRSCVMIVSLAQTRPAPSRNIPPVQTSFYHAAGRRHDRENRGVFMSLNKLNKEAGSLNGRTFLSHENRFSGNTSIRSKNHRLTAPSLAPRHKPISRPARLPQRHRSVLVENARRPSHRYWRRAFSPCCGKGRVFPECTERCGRGPANARFRSRAG